MSKNPGNNALFTELDAAQNRDWALVDRIFLKHGLQVKMGELVELFGSLHDMGIMSADQAVAFVFGGKQEPRYIQ